MTRMTYQQGVELAKSLMTSGGIKKFITRKQQRNGLPTPPVDLNPERIQLLKVRRKYGAKTKRPELAGMPRRIYLTMHARIRRIENKAMI